MPADFDRCVKGGGKIRTKRLNAKEYVRYCILNGKSYRGHTKQYKKVLKGGKRGK